MKESEAIKIATEFVSASWKEAPRCMGAKRTGSQEWTVYFETRLPGQPADSIIDGPTLVIVDAKSGAARFLLSM